MSPTGLNPHSSLPSLTLSPSKMASSSSSEQDQNKAEAQRLKTLAEQKYTSNPSSLKSAFKHAKRAHRLHPTLDGLSELLTAFNILRTSLSTPPDYYKILQTQPFSHFNIIKKQYRKLALTLHPDKNPFIASEHAFKLVGEAFGVLSDKVRRKEYDTRLRIFLQEKAVGDVGFVGNDDGTFWTVCLICQLMHQFDRKYLGLNLVCPNCKKSFKAVEVSGNEVGFENVERNVEDGAGNDEIGAWVSDKIRERRGGVRIRKMSSVGEVLERSRVGKTTKSFDGNGDMGGGGIEGDRLRSKRVARVSSVGEVLERLKVGKSSDLDENGDFGGSGGIAGLRSKSKRVAQLSNVVSNSGGVDDGVKKLGFGDEEEGKSGGDEVLERPNRKRAKVVGEEMMTLAEMQMLVKKKVNEEKMKLKENEREIENNVVEKRVRRRTPKGENFEIERKRGLKNDNFDSMVIEDGDECRIDNEKVLEDVEKNDNENVMEKRARRKVLKGDDNLETDRRRGSKSGNSGIEKKGDLKSGNLDIMVVEDSDFYDFDKDRVGRSFKKGQVWGVYDDDDGMPRHYALIDEVVSTNPFEVKMCWLDFQNNGDEKLICWEKMGLHISCGRFKVSSKTRVNSVKMFSHVVDCQKAAREMYRIYPKKGSIWALYNENALDSEERDLLVKDKRYYDIAIFLTTYSEIHGLSMAYLEKVDGFKTIFKRKEIGCHAIRWLEKDDVRLFSHQIPSRKLYGEEASELPKDCWELDPASLPPQLLTSGWGG